MKVSEALASRFSCRAYLDLPVPLATIRSILQQAQRAPSGGNLQPWQVQVLTGKPLRALVSEVQDALADHPTGDKPAYQIYPEPLKEPYRARRFQNGADLYSALGIEREDRPARIRQFQKNFAFFGAPAAIMLLVDKSMGAPQWADLGAFMQSILLLAREYGLHSCAQEAWAFFEDIVRRHLALAEEQMVFCGIALGYGDLAAPVNRWRTDRAALDEIATFRGFEA
ncbi:nitroreductase [Rhodoligotrophos ferricapiens]|uniref:nitroreductase n=1 Tax=Rhodoligotrophos ferricapiens TaxID=3069264 RepID=UPI00315D975A